MSSTSRIFSGLLVDRGTDISGLYISDIVSISRYYRDAYNVMICPLLSRALVFRDGLMLSPDVSVVIDLYHVLGVTCSAFIFALIIFSELLSIIICGFYLSVINDYLSNSFIINIVYPARYRNPLVIILII